MSGAGYLDGSTSSYKKHVDGPTELRKTWSPCKSASSRLSRVSKLLILCSGRKIPLLLLLSFLMRNSPSVNLLSSL